MNFTMEFCDDHWEKLHAAVSRQGLGHLVSANEEIMALRTLADLEQSNDPHMFDPLLFTMWNLLANGSRITGVPLLLTDGCPLCHLIIEHERTCQGDPRCRTVEEIQSWPDLAANAARQRWEAISGTV